MSKKLDPQRNLTMAEMAEVSNDEYAEYLRERIAIGIDTAETLNLYHVVKQKRFTDELGKNHNPIELQTFTKDEWSPNLTNIKRVLENQGYAVKVLHDPTEPVEAKKEEPTDVIEPDNDENPTIVLEEQTDEAPVLPSGENAKTGRGRGRKSNN